MRTVHRGRVFAVAAVAAVGLFALALPGRVTGADAPLVKATTAQALDWLKEGNARFVSGKLQHPNGDVARREALAKGQAPFAVIVTCSDSRVPPELLFDRGLGDLFVVRTAGEVVDEVALGSVEYAVEHLGTPLVVVMGHSQCGAVKATLDVAKAGGKAPEGGIGALITAILPAVEHAKGEAGDVVANTVKAQVELTAEHLREGKNAVAELAEKGTIQVSGAVYDLSSGKVEWLAH